MYENKNNQIGYLTSYICEALVGLIGCALYLNGFQTKRLLVSAKATLSRKDQKVLLVPGVNGKIILPVQPVYFFKIYFY